MRPKALDLFCGAGGAAMGLHRAGFDVVGIDIKSQPRYPFAFIQADALEPPVRLSDFDLVWASPPCQGYSRTRHLPWLKNNVHPLLIDPVRKMFKQHASLWVIENVGDAPLEGVALRGSMFGLPFRRLRRFEASFLVMAPSPGREPIGQKGSNFGGRLTRQARQMDDVPWMDDAGRAQAIPPAYSEHIGRYALMALGKTA